MLMMRWCGDGGDGGVHGGDDGVRDDSVSDGCCDADDAVLMVVMDTSMNASKSIEGAPAAPRDSNVIKSCCNFLPEKHDEK